MNPDFKRGLKTGFIVYAIGITVIVLTDLILGFDSGGHLPPTSFVLALALIILAIIRVIRNASKIFTGRSVELNKGEILIHLIFLGLIASYIFYLYLNQDQI